MPTPLRLSRSRYLRRLFEHTLHAGCERGPASVCHRRRRLARKLGGGCSATNACLALRGSPTDYDAWGFEDWRFTNLLPFFRRLETDFDSDDECLDGPLLVRRYAGK